MGKVTYRGYGNYRETDQSQISIVTGANLRKSSTKPSPRQKQNILPIKGKPGERLLDKIADK